MHKSLLTITLLAASLTAAAEAPQAQWGYFFGNAGSDQSTAVAVAKDGNVLWLGTTSVGGNPANNDLSLLCTDPQGNTLWEVKSTNGDFAANQGNIAVNTDGSIVLTTKFRSTANASGITIVDAAGSELSLDTAEPRSYDLLVLSLDASGNINWHTIFDADTNLADGTGTSADAVSSTALAIDTEGYIYVGGNYRTNFTVDGHTLVPANVQGWTGDSQKSCGNMFLVRLTPEGKYYDSLIGEGEFGGTSAIQALAWADDALYVYGYAQGTGSFTLADTELTPSEYPSPVVGRLATLNAPLASPSWLKCFPGDAIDGKNALQNVGISAFGSSLWIAGQYNLKISDPDNADNFVAATQGSQREGFVISLDTATGAWRAAADSRVDFPEVTKITGYFKVIPNPDDADQVYVYGYAMDANIGIFLRGYDAKTLAVVDNENYSIATGGGVPSAIACAYDEATATAYITGRGNKAFTLAADPDIVTDAPQGWDVLLAAYSLSSSASGCQIIATDATMTTDGAVYDIYGRRVATMSGNTLPALAPGIYIANGRKHLVR